MFNMGVRKILSILGLVVLVLGTLVIGGYAWAQGLAEKNYYYQSIEVNIQINQDSTFVVEEKQTYRLSGNFGYFYRDIELKDLDHLSEIEVFDSQGKKLTSDEYEDSYKGNQRHIQWNFNRRDFNDELKSWTVKYKVHGGLGFYDNYDELYWNAIFAERTVPVVRAEVIVHLPAEVDKNQITQRIFVGPLASKNETSNYEVIDNRTVKFWGDNLRPNEFLTIVVTWPKGLVKKPFLYRNQIINWLVLLLALALPIFVFSRAYQAWRESGQDPKIDKTIIAQYEPPEDLLPGVVGILVDQRFDVREVTATVINLAVRGYLRIREGRARFFRGQEYIFEKLKEGKELKPFENKIMESVFSTRSVVSTDDLKNKFYRRLPSIKKELHQETAQTGYLTGNIQGIRNKFRIPYIILIIIGSFLIIFSAILSSRFGFSGVHPPLLLISFFVSGAIGFIFAQLMPALTQQGAQEKWKWLGFKEYLHTAERFRLGAETVETFSKYLPYAIVFGVEKEWADRFADLKYEQPNWYVPAVVQVGGRGEAAPSFSGLTSSISSFSSSISKTFGSTPGGSGAGAGGGAGGGGGGGGGGAG